MPKADHLLSELRTVVPRRGLSPAEARRIAELQAAKLLEHADITSAPVPAAIVGRVPGLSVRRRTGWPTSGMATTTDKGWAIILRADDSVVRQRFSCIHEFKHVLDDPFIEWLYPERGNRSSEDRAEEICDYFAACVLMPKAWIKRDWGRGVQTVERLARRYEVSRIATNVRLQQLKLIEPSPRCAGTARQGVFA